MHYLDSILKRINTLIHLTIVKMLHRGQFSFKGISVVNNSSHFTINDQGHIIIGKNIGIRRNCEVSVSENGKINIEDNVFMNNGCMVVVHCQISVGDGTRLGPQVMIFDHDYNYKDRDAFKEGSHISAPVIIGKNCWIGAGTIILKGSQIGDNCVVGAGCVLKGNYADDSLIIQKRDELNKLITKQR